MQFNAEQPIFIQIGKDIQEQIISGQLVPGEKLHSVREYSVLYEVSPLTIHRSMQYLEKEGIIYSQKGVGSFVKEDIRGKLEGTMLDTEILEFIGRLRKCGLSDSEILERVKKLLSAER